MGEIKEEEKRSVNSRALSLQWTRGMRQVAAGSCNSTITSANTLETANGSRWDYHRFKRPISTPTTIHIFGLPRTRRRSRTCAVSHTPHISPYISIEHTAPPSKTQATLILTNHTLPVSGAKNATPTSPAAKKPPPPKRTTASPKPNETSTTSTRTTTPKKTNPSTAPAKRPKSSLPTAKIPAPEARAGRESGNWWI